MKRFFRKFDKTAKVIAGACIGLVNGFFGSGGGILAVSAMETLGEEQRKAHATSILVIMPLSIVSAILYFIGGSISFSGNTWWLLGGAAAGGLAGALLLGKLQGTWIDVIFTLLIIASGIRMVF